jgi:cell pole-organizing protein PopZ
VGSAHLAKQRMSADQLAEHEEGIRRAEATWRKVQDMMMDIPISVRQAVYNLCVLNEAIGPILLRDVRQVLDAMVPRLNEGRSTKAKPMPEAGLLSHKASTAIGSAFNTLTETVKRHEPTLEDVVRETLRPMLKSWLDENLLRVVETLVQAEIERVTRGR